MSKLARAESSASAVRNAVMAILIVLSSRMILTNFYDLSLIGGFLLICGFWLAYKSKQALPGSYYYIALLTAWIAITSIYYQVYNIRTAGGELMRILIGLLAASILGRQFSSVFTRWMSYLSGISIVLFLVGAIFPDLVNSVYDLLPDWTKTIGGVLIDGRLTGGWRRASIFFYTISPDRPYQNHGFMWEPAAFALMTVSALILRWSSGRRRLDLTNALYIFATLTTFSTTGYICLFIVLMAALAARGRMGVIVMLAALPIVVSTFFLADFLFPKISAEFLMGYSAQMRYSLSRYASFQLDWEEIVYHPLIGWGLFDESRAGFTDRLPSNNGLSDFVVRYGFLWTAGSYLLLAGGILSQANAAKIGAALFVVSAMLFSWSEKFMELPLFITIQFLTFMPRVSPIRNIAFLQQRNLPWPRRLPAVRIGSASRRLDL